MWQQSRSCVRSTADFAADDDRRVRLQGPVRREAAMRSILLSVLLLATAPLAPDVAATE